MFNSLTHVLSLNAVTALSELLNSRAECRRQPDLQKAVIADFQKNAIPANLVNLVLASPQE